MKKSSAIAIVTAFFLLFNLISNTFPIITAYADTIGQEVVTFPDANFEKAVRQTINKPNGDIYKSDVENVTRLTESNCQISSIEGIQNFTNLKSLSLYGNNIKDFTPLTYLGNITEMTLGNNRLCDISFLSSFVCAGKIQYIDISNNNVSDISPLESCLSLTQIYMNNNNIKDISSLAKLGELQCIDIDFNQITDISPLSRLTNMNYLGASDNYITDVSPLASLTKLKTLNLNHNPIFTLDPIKNLPNLNDFRAWSLYSQNSSDSRYQAVIDKATSIIKTYIKPDMTDFQKILAIRDYIVKNTYNSQEGQNYYNAYGTLVEGKGVCSGYTEGTLLLLDLAGIKSYYTQGNTQGSGHAWNVVRLNDKYYNLDTLWDDCKDSYNFFMISNSELLKQDPGRTFKPETYRDCSYDKYQVVRKVLNAHNNSTNKQDYFIKGENVYYSNTEDNNKLYKTNIESNETNKLSDDIVKYVNANDTWVYYVNTADNKIYKINTDGTGRQLASELIKGIKLSSGILSPSFNPIVFNYNVKLQYGTTDAPEVTPIGNDTDVNIVVNEAAQLPGKTTIDVKDSSGITLSTYTVNFTVADSYDPNLEKVYFADNNIESSVRSLIGISDRDLIEGDVQGITNLQVDGKDISDLSGIENLKNLTSLTLQYNKIADITPLSKLTKLKQLNLYGNKITDISPLKNMPLFNLNLSFNQVTDISPLAGKTSLENLFLDSNPITSIEPIKNLNIQYLLVYGIMTNTQNIKNDMAYGWDMSTSALTGVSLDGANKKVLTSDNSQYIVTGDDYIYYTNRSDSYRHYKIKYDGSGRVRDNDTLSLLYTDCGAFTPAFNKEITSYILNVDNACYIPQVGGFATDSTSTVSVTKADSLIGTTTIVVKSDDGSVSKTYTVKRFSQVVQDATDAVVKAEHSRLKADIDSAAALIDKIYFTGDKTALTSRVNAIKVLCTVSFDSQGGSSVENLTTDYNSNITKPADPTRIEYEFGGWYKEAECTTPWDFTEDKVTTNITLYAKWAIDKYAVSFDAQGGSSVESLTTDYNSNITKPADPTRIGYEFGGWYKEAECTTPWDFTGDKVSTNITLYAKWRDICDINRDGEVNILDLALVAQNYNTRNTGDKWNPNFDLNKDNIIDIFDLVLVSKKIKLASN